MTDPYKMENPYESDGSAEAAKAKKRKPLVIGILVVVVLAIVVAAGFFAWNALRPVEIGAYENEPITLVGITDSEITVTDAELIQLNCIEITASGTGSGANGESRAGEVTGYGPKLQTLLAKYGCEPTDFNRIVCTCKDGYDVVIYGDMLKDEIVLSIAQGKDPLWESHQPLRLIIPSEATGMWAYGVTRMTFER